MKIKNGFMYWADLGPGRGPEPGKLRPVLVVQSDHLNDLRHNTTIALVCTSQVKGDSVMRIHLSQGIAGNPLPTDILVDQVRAIMTSAFVRELGPVPKIVMKDVTRKLALVLNLDLKL